MKLVTWMHFTVGLIDRWSWPASLIMYCSHSYTQTTINVIRWLAQINIIYLECLEIISIKCIDKIPGIGQRISVSNFVLYFGRVELFCFLLFYIARPLHIKSQCCGTVIYQGYVFSPSVPKRKCFSGPVSDEGRLKASIVTAGEEQGV